MKSNLCLQELEEFCFKFSLNHMTAIIETEGFASLDEQMVKSFIRKAAKFGAFKSQDKHYKCVCGFNMQNRGRRKSHPQQKHTNKAAKTEHTAIVEHGLWNDSSGRVAVCVCKHVQSVTNIVLIFFRSIMFFPQVIFGHYHIFKCFSIKGGDLDEEKNLQGHK